MTTHKSPFDAMHMFANLSADCAAPTSESMSKKVAYLEEKVEFMRIANQALWEIVSEKFEITTKVQDPDPRSIFGMAFWMAKRPCGSWTAQLPSKSEYKRALCLYCEAPSTGMVTFSEPLNLIQP